MEPTKGEHNEKGQEEERGQRRRMQEEVEVESTETCEDLAIKRGASFFKQVLL